MTEFMINNNEHEVNNNTEFKFERSNETMNEERMNITENNTEAALASSKRRTFLSPLKEQSGLTTVEIIMLLVVLVSLVVIFRDQMATFITGLIAQIFEFDGSI